MSLLPIVRALANAPITCIQYELLGFSLWCISWKMNMTFEIQKTSVLQTNEDLRAPNPRRSLTTSSIGCSKTKSSFFTSAPKSHKSCAALRVCLAPSRSRKWRHNVSSPLVRRWVEQQLAVQGYVKPKINYEMTPQREFAFSTPLSCATQVITDQSEHLARCSRWCQAQNQFCLELELEFI